MNYSEISNQYKYNNTEYYGDYDLYDFYDINETTNCQDKISEWYSYLYINFIIISSVVSLVAVVIIIMVD
jgi:hypothetical protein